MYRHRRRSPVIATVIFVHPGVLAHRCAALKELQQVFAEARMPAKAAFFRKSRGIRLPLRKRSILARPRQRRGHFPIELHELV
jgi:hypothetical protein